MTYIIAGSGALPPPSCILMMAYRTAVTRARARRRPITLRTLLGPLAPCRPGEFYLRELPPLRAVLDDLSGVAGLLVVDGYTDLDPGDRPGLAVPPARTAPRPPPRTRP